MTELPVYHDAMRALQDQNGTRRLADRLADRRRRTAFTEDDKAFIENRNFFMLATADADGFLDCSYKGGAPGFAQLTGSSSLVFPSLDDNSKYRSLGNIVANLQIGRLFMNFDAPQRLRVNGRAVVSWDDQLIDAYPGAEAVVHVVAEGIFTNCPRYIHREGEISAYLETPQSTAKLPDWKPWPEFTEMLHKRC